MSSIIIKLEWQVVIILVYSISGLKSGTETPKVKNISGLKSDRESWITPQK